MSFTDVTSTTTNGNLAASARPASDRPSLPGTYSWTRRAEGQWKWLTRSEWSRVIHNGHNLDWSTPASSQSARLVKANDGRQVWRIELDEHLFFAKLYFPPRGWARVRRLVMGSDSCRERQVAEYARRYGIQTVQPVACADALGSQAGAVSILITEGLPNALPLNDLWFEQDPADRDTRAAKNLIIDRVARLIAHAHQNGFEHTDLHAGNILVDANGSGDHQALFVDLHNIRFGRPVSDRAVVRNLAQFHQWFRLRAPLTDRLRFLDRYLHWRDVYQTTGAFGRPIGQDAPELRESIERMAQAHANALYAKRDRRASRTGRYYTRLHVGGGWRGHAFLKAKHPVQGSAASLATFEPEQWREWLKHPEQWTQADQAHYTIKKSASGVVCRSRLPVDGRGLDVICKRSTPRHLGKRIKNLFRRSRAMRTWRLANALLNRQVPTARPLAVLERRVAGVTVDSLIITEYIENAHDLDTLLTVQIRDLDPVQQRRIKQQVIEAFAGVFRALHGRGFYHRDMKAPNVMVQWDPEREEPPRVLLVDLDGIHQTRRVRRRSWIRALMRLNVSIDHCRRVTRTDRLRLLKACLVRPGRPDPEWRGVWKEIAALSDKKRDHKNRQFERMMAKYGRI